MRLVLTIAAVCLLSGAVQAQTKKEEQKVRSTEAAKQASELLKDQKVADALKILDAAIKNDSSSSELYILRGQANMKARRLKNALSDCDQAVRLKSDSVLAYHCRALAFAYNGDHKGALKDLGFALKLDPEFIPAYESRAGMNQGRGNLQSALDDYNVLTKLKPADGVIFWRRANLQLAMNNTDAALKDLNESLRLEPDSAAVYQDRARLHEKLNQLDKAIADHSATIRLNPKSADAYLNRGSDYARIGKQDLATADFQKAAQLNPGYGEVIAKLQAPPTTETAKASEAKPAVAKPNLDQAVAAIPQANDPSKPVVGQLKTQKSVIAGTGTPADAPKTQATETKPVAAVSAPATPAPTSQPAEPAAAPASAEKDPMAELGEVLATASQQVKAKEFAKAIDTYTKALAMKGDMAGTLADRGKLYLETKQWQNAIKDFSEALKINPKEKGVYLGRCTAYFHSAAYTEAVADCTKAIDTEVTPEAWQLRAKTYLAMKNLDKAIVDFRVSAEIKQDAPDTYYQLGGLYKESGDLLMALNAYTRAIQQRPAYVEAYRARAEIRQILGDAVGSQQDANRAAGKK